MKIQKVIIKDFKNIEDLEQEINGSNILLLGENGVGKSSFIQAIQIALGMTERVPGKTNGEIAVITSEDGKEYQFKTVIKDGKHKLEVTAPNGIRDTRKSTIGSLVGSIDFNIDEFVELSKSKAGKKKQVEIVKSFLDSETLQNLDSIERDIAYNFEERTNLNREIKTYESFLSELNISDRDLSDYSTAIDVVEVNKKLQDSISHNAKINDVKVRFEERKEKIETLAAQIEDLKNDLATLKGTQSEASDWIKKNKEVNTEEFEKQIQDASNHNEKYNKVQDYLTKSDKLKKFNKEQKELTDKIESSREALSDAIKDCGLPVEGLNFTEDAILYNGIEVDENSLSTSEIMHLGIQLKMAKNPNINVILLERGESLGNKKLKDIQDLCKKHGYQIIMEKVEPGTEELKIEIMPEL